jgi:hypothetical protein
MVDGWSHILVCFHELMSCVPVWQFLLLPQAKHS